MLGGTGGDKKGWILLKYIMYAHEKIVKCIIMHNYYMPIKHVSKQSKIKDPGNYFTNNSFLNVALARGQYLIRLILVHISKGNLLLNT